MSISADTPIVQTRSPHQGQLGFAHRFAVNNGGRLMYAHGIGWHEWDGHRWAPCLDGAQVRYASAELATARQQVWDQYPENEEARKKRYRELAKLETHSGVSGILSLASSLAPLAVAGNALDAHPLLFNTESGTLDLDRAVLKEPAPRDRITKIAGAAFDPTAYSAPFERFLERILPNTGVRAYVQRVLGYAMLGVVREHILPIWTGTGANGKGTLRDAVLCAFGEYARELDPELLMERRSDAHSTEKTDLLGLRLVFMSETDRHRRFSEATMKRLVGGDKITARRMRQDTITFDPSHTLIMLTNYLPPASSDPAIWRRIRVIRFDQTITADEMDGQLPEKLKADAPAVLAWVYRGYLEYRRVGLAPPALVVEATDEYREDSDQLGTFLAERTADGHPDKVRVGSRALYEAWVDWCKATGEDAGTESEFGKSVAQKGYRRIRTDRGYRWRGLELIDDQGEGTSL